MPPENGNRKFPVQDNPIIRVQDPDLNIDTERRVRPLPLPASVDPAPEVDEILTRKGRSPRFKILIGNRDIAELGLDRLVSQFRIVEDEDKPDLLELEFTKAEALFNRAIFNEPNFISIETGYQLGGTARLEPRGRFVIVKSELFFSTGGSRLRLICTSEQTLLASEEKRRAWRNVTDSDIAERIASEYPSISNTDIETTEFKYDSVIQANMTDWEFLRTRASLHGFIVFVRDGILHFHSVRENDINVNLTVNGPNANISNLSGQVEHFRGAPKFRGAIVDPFTGKTIEVVSGLDPDVVFESESDRRFNNRVLNARALGRGSTEFIEPVQSLPRQDAVEREVQSAANAARFVVLLSMSANAHEKIHPGDVVTVRRLGRFSGKYIVRTVTHVVQGRAGYFMRLRIRRTFTGEVQPEENETIDATNRSNVTGVHLFGTFDDQTPKSVEFGAPDPVTGRRSLQKLGPRDQAILRETGVDAGVFQNELELPSTFRTKILGKPSDKPNTSQKAGQSEQDFKSSITRAQFEDTRTIILDPEQIEEIP